MAQAMASMAGLRGSSQAVLEGSLPVSRLSTSGAARTALPRSSFSVRASGEAETSRRAMLGLAAAGIASVSLVQGARAASSIKIGPPPPPSGGLPGTENSDEARDLDLPLKERFFLQPLSPTEAAARAKESAKEIISVKSAIDKKAWPYVRDDLRLKSSYLRYDLKTIIDSTPNKEEKKQLKALTKDLFDTINLLDYAAKMKSPADAEKYYAATVSSLNGVISKLG